MISYELIFLGRKGVTPIIPNDYIISNAPKLPRIGETICLDIWRNERSGELRRYEVINVEHLITVDSNKKVESLKYRVIAEEREKH